MSLNRYINFDKLESLQLIHITDRTNGIYETSTKAIVIVLKTLSVIMPNIKTLRSK